MRPLEMIILIIAVILLLASMFAIGVYGPELVKLIQQGSGIGAENSSPLEIIISRITGLLTRDFASEVDVSEVETVYGSTGAYAIDSLTGRVVVPDAVSIVK